MKIFPDKRTSTIKGGVFLYHATYAPYLPSIRANGLGGVQVLANYDCSEPGVTYLAKSPAVAYSYAEVSDAVPDTYLDEIVILSIPADTLDPARISKDENVRADEPEYEQTIAYRGVITSFEVI